MLQSATLARLWPRCPPAIRDGMVAAAPAVFPKYGLDSPAVVAIFMAQISHECGAGTEIVENLNYSPQGIVRTWPSRFKSVADALPFAHHPQLLANKVYNGRMGNKAGSNDGWLFRGRGGTNCTGHDGYFKLALKTALDLLNNPNLVNDPAQFLLCAVVDFVLCGCLPYAKDGNFRMVTLRLNGGLVGLAQRQAWLPRWQSALAAEHGEAAVIPIPPPRPAGIIRMGDTGFEVEAVQKRLGELGYVCGKEDGEFHEATRDAVNSFKGVHGLPIDDVGTVDQPTKDAMAADTAIEKPVGEDRAAATPADLRAAGSRTVTAADSIGTLAKAKIAIGSAAAAAAGGVQSGTISLDTVQDKVDQAKHAYSMWDGMKDTVLPLLHNPVVLWGGLALVVIGAVILYHSRSIILARIDDHRSGANLGR